MSKKIKMCLYGVPGVGKSVFASKAPRPFFITSDGNYAWLEDFGANPDAHIQVNSWAEAKKAFTQDYDDYDTIVVDLVEDLFKWCEKEFCVRNKIDHVSDIGYGKGYDITRNEFFIELSKLINMDKHIIFISHGISVTEKDRRGVEHTKWVPSTRIPDKVWDMLEGRLRYFLRCYLKAEEAEGGKLIKKRYLSLVPKENEFGIIRGVDENKIPHDIELDWDTFINALGVDIKEDKPRKKKPAKIVEEDSIPGMEEKVKVEVAKPKSPEVTSSVKVEESDENLPKQNPELTPCEEEVEEQPKQKEEVNTLKLADTQPTQELSNEDKLAALKAKLAQIKKGDN